MRVARYFFHVYDESGFVEDEEGRELDGLPTVRTQAIKGARSIMMEEVRYGRLDLRGRIEIVDDEGRPVLILPFSEAVEVIEGDLPETDPDRP